MMVTIDMEDNYTYWMHEGNIYRQYMDDFSDNYPDVWSDDLQQWTKII